MKKFVVDANAFLRLFLNDIPDQANKTEELLKQAKEGKSTLFVPQIIIFEIVFALEKYYHLSKAEIIDNLKSILAASYLTIQNRNVFKRAIELYSTQSISLTDCFLICFAEHKDANVFTFDRKLRDLHKKS